MTKAYKEHCKNSYQTFGCVILALSGLNLLYNWDNYLSIPVLLTLDLFMILTVFLKKYVTKIENYVGPIFFLFCCLKCLASLLLFDNKGDTYAAFLLMNIVLWIEYTIICQFIRTSQWLGFTIVANLLM